jgi:dipeptidase
MNPDIINDAQPVKRKRSGGGRAFHSRLEPFVDFIREQRQRRKTWKEIAAALSGEMNCAITAQGVHQFYRRHLQRRAKGNWEDEANHSESQTTRPSAAASRPQSRPAPLPPPATFKRPNVSTTDTKEFT